MKIKEIINYEWKKKNITQNRALKILLYFFVIMIFCTFLSRFSDSLTVPIVQVGNSVQGNINHNINSEGTIYGTKEKNISTVNDIKIKSVNVNVGDKVKNGDVILILDIDDINSKITLLQKEISSSDKKYSRAVVDYNNAKTKFEDEIASFKIEMNDAKNKYDAETELELKGSRRTEYEEKKITYDNAVKSKDETLLSFKRAVEDAEIDDSNSESKKKLSELNQLKSEEGKIIATEDGYITNVLAESGGVTMADSSSSYNFKTSVSSELKKYITKGTKVQLEMTDDNDKIDGLTISSVSVNKEDSKMLDITVNLPVGKGEVGTMAKLIVVGGESKNQLCIPLAAIREGENNDKFILIMSEKDSILGTEKVAKKVSVKVLDKDSRYAAIEDSLLSSEDEIIITSNKDIEDGDRVRKGDN